MALQFSEHICDNLSLEGLTTFVLLIPEGVVERRTAVHPVRAFTSIGRDCVGCFVDTWKGDCLGRSSRGQPRGALPLHQVTQRQFIKFADPTRRSGHNNLLHVLPRRVHISSGLWFGGLHMNLDGTCCGNIKTNTSTTIAMNCR